MKEQILDFLVQFFEYGIFFYCTVVMSSYLIIGIVSAFEVIKHKSETELEDFRSLLCSELAPSISVIAPAYNEDVTIVDNIRSLLSIHYAKMEVIVVNDGSKDDTLSNAIEAYDLEKVPFAYFPKINTKQVRGIYKSKNKAFKKLIVVDKENGGKADAINVGINVSSAEYFACIDVDCIIEPDAFLKMVRPIMRAGTEKIIAVGGIVWLTNDSDIENGKLLKIRSPKSYIGRIQVVEYFRAFLLGRTAWSKINGLLLISGAFGLFQRDLVIEAGGYFHKTVGEDMELVMRMHAILRARKEKYRIAYVPEPLCWTEAPDSYAVLKKQRNRWARGTIECLKIHKKMFFNRKYGVLGLISYPYWLFAEWLAPFVEAGGLIFFALLAYFGLVNWSFFFLLVVYVFVFAIMISTFSVVVQESTYKRYPTHKDLLKLFITLVIEPFYYHPKTVVWALRGNYDHFFNKNNGWGEMKRTGFKKK